MTKCLLCTSFALLGYVRLWAGLPDLIINSNTVNPIIVMQTFNSNDCSVVYGCASAGTRLLLEFTTEVWNVGDADLVLGNPATNSLFYYSPCSGQYYFRDFMLNGLLDTNGNPVVPSQKGSFCIGDEVQSNPAANSNRIYNCSYQGLQQGWADDYPAGVPCQWIDVTGVPSGKYVLQLTVNPLGLVPESNTNNNTLYVPVFIPAQCQPPINDDFADAQVLSPVTPQSIRSANSCASTESGEPWIVNVQGGASVWFSWTPTNSQFVNLTTLGSSFDKLLAVYVGTNIDFLSQVAANNDIGPGTVQSGVSFNAVAGTNYMISVDGVNGAQGSIQLNFNSPPNDMFADCEDIFGVSGQVSGYNVGAAQEPGELAHDSIPGGHSVWYCWTAPTSGVEVFDTIGSDFDTVLAVYTGNDVSNLTAVAADDDSGGNKTSRLSFLARYGTTYHIAVDGYATTNANAPSGTIELNWNSPPRLAVTAVNPLVLTITGGSYGWYAAQSSTDLRRWQTFSTFYVGQSTYNFQDTRGMPAAYYRVQLVPPP